MKLEIQNQLYCLKVEGQIRADRILISVVNPDGEYSVAVEMEKLPKLISFLQAIDLDHEGGAE